jgi:transposase-like protein
MSEAVRAVLSGIQTVEEMIAVFGNEQQRGRLFEAMVWPKGRICPACGYKSSIAIASRDMERRRARPGLYQCSSSDCRFQFTATTHTPLHSTKLPLSTWLKALWLMLQSDKGLSSVRLAEALGVSQPTAWRMGHALRLLVARETPVGGTVEIDEFYFGGRPKQQSDAHPPRRGRKGQRRTTKTPVLAMVQRSDTITVGAAAGDARAAVVDDLSFAEAERILEKEVETEAHLMSDEWTAFITAGQGFTAHDTVRHSTREYVRGSVHTSSAEGFNSRVRRTIAGVFHHISPEYADLYFHEIGFRWSQHIVTGQATRRTRHGREIIKPIWSCVPPALQLPKVLQAATGRQMRRTRKGGLSIKSSVAFFRL